MCAVGCMPAVCHAESAPYKHDGFYLQMSLGLGYLKQSANSDGEQSAITGASLNSSLWIGGSLIPGLVLGGGTLDAIAINPSLRDTAAGSTTKSTTYSRQLQIVGLVSDFYPDPRSGLHFKAMIGYAQLPLIKTDNYGYSVPSGLGVMAGVGYDFWVSQEWSIGVLGRFSYAALSDHDDDDGGPTANPTVAPAALASFTYN
jgi:hypothetical protein